MPKTATAVRSTQKSPETPRDPAPTRPHKNLTETQEEVADLASRMLLHGGEREDVELVLTGLARHQYRSMSFAQRACPAEVDKNAKQCAAKAVPRWYQRLRTQWLTKRLESSEATSGPDPKPVAEMVRANIRSSLRSSFEEFMTNDFGIEKAWLLNEVLQDVNSGVDMGDAIYYAMDRAGVYIRVPAQQEKRVKEYIALLVEGETSD